MKNVLISVSDRTGILEFARGLDKLGFGVVATSGTQKFLASEGIPAKTVSETTGFPEILDGRVKTLHPKILGAILADIGKESHLAQLKEHGIPVFELVVCNLYPFGAKPGIENIDIGGITLIRAAAKNHKHANFFV
jgi:phosphoribosylaminoimidazolecarboxamide formyltransferase/IMP cyclohydrolase